LLARRHGTGLGRTTLRDAAPTKASGSSQSMRRCAPQIPREFATITDSCGLPTAQAGLVSCLPVQLRGGHGLQAASRRPQSWRSINAMKRCAAGAVAAWLSAFGRPVPAKNPSSKVSSKAARH